jgi:hypothetical protein
MVWYGALYQRERPHVFGVRDSVIIYCVRTDPDGISRRTAGTRYARHSTCAEVSIGNTLLYES